MESESACESEMQKCLIVAWETFKICHSFARVYISPEDSKIFIPSYKCFIQALWTDFYIYVYCSSLLLLVLAVRSYTLVRL